MVDIKDIKIDSHEDPERHTLPGEQKRSYWNTIAYVAATAAVAGLFALCGRYACINDDISRQKLEKKYKKPAVTQNSGLESLTNHAIASQNNNSNTIQSLKTLYNLADDSYYAGRKDRTQYRKSIDACTEALVSIGENKVWKHYKDDFLYLRGRSKTHTGELDGAVDDFLGALANLSLERDQDHDQGIANQVNTALNQLLNGDYKTKVQASIQKHFRDYNPVEQQKILDNLLKESPRNKAYQLLR